MLHTFQKTRLDETYTVFKSENLKLRLFEWVFRFLLKIAPFNVSKFSNSVRKGSSRNIKISVLLSDGILLTKIISENTEPAGTKSTRNS